MSLRRQPNDFTAASAAQKAADFISGQFVEEN